MPFEVHAGALWSFGSHCDLSPILLLSGIPLAVPEADDDICAAGLHETLAA